MIFKIAAETYNTSDMISLVIKVIYLTIYVHRERQLAFVQTFDDTSGVNICQATPQQCSKLLELLDKTGFPAILSHTEQLKDIVSQTDNRDAGKNAVTNYKDCTKASTHLERAKDHPHVIENQEATEHSAMTSTPNPPENRMGDSGLGSKKVITNRAAPEVQL